MFHKLVQGLKDAFSTESKAEPSPSNHSVSSTTDFLPDLEQAVDALRIRVEALRQEAAEASEVDPVADRREAERAIAAVHTQIRENILAEHLSLGTGFNSAEMDATADVLDALELSYSSTDAILDSFIHSAIVRAVVARCAPLLWDAFHVMLANNHRDWPQSDTLPPYSTPDMVERIRQRELAEIRQAFVSSSPLRISRRMRGKITVWGANYPSPTSSLWKTVVLQAVAFGLLGRVLRISFKFLEEHEGDLKRQTDEMLHDHVHAVHASLSRGITSLGEADRVLRSATKLCGELVPELAWKIIEAPVTRELQQIRQTKG